MALARVGLALGSVRSVTMAVRSMFGMKGRAGVRKLPGSRPADPADPATVLVLRRRRSIGPHPRSEGECGADKQVCDRDAQIGKPRGHLTLACGGAVGVVVRQLSLDVARVAAEHSRVDHVHVSANHGGRGRAEDRPARHRQRQAPQHPEHDYVGGADRGAETAGCPKQGEPEREGDLRAETHALQVFHLTVELASAFFDEEVDLLVSPRALISRLVVVGVVNRSTSTSNEQREDVACVDSLILGEAHGAPTIQRAMAPVAAAATSSGRNSH